MTIKEKIIKSMFSYQDEHDSIVVDKDGLATHLIANDIVPVVRCKGCKHYNLLALACTHKYFNRRIAMDGFCSYGERRIE